MKQLSYLLLFFFITGCSSKKREAVTCDIMKYGTFDVYQKDQKVGSFYRKDSLQVETYVGKKITGLTKVKQIDKCTYVLRSHWIKKEIDSIHFTAVYTVKSKNDITYLLTPTYLDSDRKLRGKVVKVSDTISKEILKKFGKL